MNKTALVCGLLLATAPVAAQQDSAAQPPKELPSVHFGAAMNIFNGDIGKNGGVQSSLRPAITAAVEYRFSAFAGAGIDASFGKLSKSERSLASNLNFESKAMQFGLHGIFYFDNDAMLRRNAPLSPFLTAGVGYLLFDPHGDLKAANDSSYFYWSDGSIRDRPDIPANQLTAQFLQRDYSYETQLKDSTENYARGCLVVPVGLGLRFRFGHNAGGNITGTYQLCFSDYIDNVKSGGNDSYLQIGASVYYKFGKAKTTQQSKYDGVDFAALEKEDYDGDGVADNQDDCPGTPKDVPVDPKGCPLDGDEDGVPDYRDKEANSKRGSIVNEFGVALENTGSAQDSLVRLRDSLFQADPSKATLERIGNEAAGTQDTGGSKRNSKIPPDLQPADKDGNDFISAAEITRAIDDFFNGDGDWTVAKINRLIDYFFEQ